MLLQNFAWLYRAISYYKELCTLRGYGVYMRLYEAIQCFLGLLCMLLDRCVRRSKHEQLPGDERLDF